jgi:hypothetical protein
MLHIKNVKKIIGSSYSDWLDISDVIIYEDYYEFILLGNKGNQQIEHITLARTKTNNGLYLMEYRNDILPLQINEFDTIDKIIVCMQTI